MKFNAFDEFGKSFDDMKQLCFPIRFTQWLKLGFITLLAGNRAGGGGSGGGQNFSTSTGSDNGTREFINDITGGATSSLREGMGVWYYLALPIIALIIIFSLVMTYITSVFSFIFLDALEKKDAQIKTGWRENKSLGWSYFLFRIVLGLLVIGVLVLAALPFIIPVLQNGFSAYIDAFTLAKLAWIIPLALALVLFFILFAIFNALVYNFSLVHAYYNKTPVWHSIKHSFGRMKQAKLEVFVYLIAKLLINIGAAVAGVIAFLITLIPFGIIAVILGILYYGLVSTYGWTAAIITALVITVISVLLLLIYVLSVLLVPVSTFTRYFAINNYKALMKNTK